MENGNDALIPNDYIIRRPKEQISGKRTITVRKYSTSTCFERHNIADDIAKSSLTYGDVFGIVKSFDLAEPERNIRSLCGLVGERNLVLINMSTNELDYFRVKHVLLATLMVEFILLPETGRLEFFVYGGKQGRIELWNMLRENFGVDEEPFARVFKPQKIRELCEGFFNRLYEVVFDPLYQDGWGTIKAADFKSERGQYINSEVEQMRRIRANQAITIQTFRSELRNQRIEQLEDVYDIKFSLLQNGGIRIEMPELKLPVTMSDLEYEMVLYDFARQSYQRIVAGKDLYEELPVKDETPQVEQLTLF